MQTYTSDGLDLDILRLSFVMGLICRALQTRSTSFCLRLVFSMNSRWSAINISKVERSSGSGSDSKVIKVFSKPSSHASNSSKRLSRSYKNSNQ